MSRASDHAYARIRAAITGGEFAPGDPLREEELAALTGVSRTPVRDALRRLEAQSLVRRTEGARALVADWSGDDIAEMFTLRALLEGHAAARAAARADARTLAGMRASNEALVAAVMRDDTEGFLDANRTFHSQVLAAAESPRLIAMLGGLVETPVVRRTAHRYDRAQLLRSHADHTELLAAFARRDAEWAQAVMTAHIRRAYHAFAEAADRRQDR